MRKYFFGIIILGGLPLATTLAVWQERAHLKPNGIEWVVIAVCAAIYVLGGILLLREARRPRIDGNGHKRAMEARRQKHYESLPPGQL